ncbi:hypothetical protein [Salidesulfovibrio brasiliensis]|uniref:hypothetical protein n=1 Tax=Salidesulfovibrio brasiliensis TaxID=221711 RepID=UPI0006D17F9F|nr:hypothetical protein [Salidesulfovibrio brasiliensis]
MTRITIITLFLAAATLTGCGGMQVEHTESTIPFGSSVSHAVEAQKLNPMPAGTDPVTGADGEYALKVLENYQKGPEPSSKDSQSLFQKTLGEMLQ